MPLRADAIVVLGCKILVSGRPGGAAARRAATAAQAWREGVAPRVIASGGRRWGAHSEARALSLALERAGVPSGAIVEELWSMTTYENAIFCAALLAQLAVRRVVLVTCSWHMPRALSNFRAMGVDVRPLSTPVVPAGSTTHAYRKVHEAVSGWLDARAMTKRRALRESAAWLRESWA
ncbi:YdcF family protein [Chondromyces apiculatus]|nr:YdcF family protein [Chondromyces apiculatus]